MKTRADARLRAEVQRFALRFACEDCAHFDLARERCVHGYPAAPRRSHLDDVTIEFCKEFELGEGDRP